MKRVVEVPQTLDDRAFDVVVEAVAKRSEGEGVLLDARHVRWADPYGMIGVLAIGQQLRQEGLEPLLQMPESAEVLSYMGRMGFQRLAAGVFKNQDGPPPRPPTGPSNVLLEITPIRSHDDVHDVIEHVHDRAGTILTEKLGYSRGDALSFGMVLSEVSQNIIEHAEAGGWVGIQTYHWARRLGRNVVVMAVHDLGIGFKGSLARDHSPRYGDRWSDAAALESAFIHGTTRFRDPGRGQGIKQIRRMVSKWGGKISIRSGTARIADIPEWDDSPPLQENLAPFPGSQILIVLPERA